jgi:hypothetical protein
MSKDIYRYTFDVTVAVEEIEASLLLAVVAAESLHGESQVRLDASHFFDEARLAVVIDANTAVGRDVNRLFVGFVRREFGEDMFRVERVDAGPTRASQETAA